MQERNRRRNKKREKDPPLTCLRMEGVVTFVEGEGWVIIIGLLNDVTNLSCELGKLEVAGSTLLQTWVKLDSLGQVLYE